MADNLGEAIAKLMKMPTVDGPKVKNLMQALTPVLDGMGGLGSAAAALAKLDVKSMEEGSESGSTLDAASGFITTLTKGMGDVVTSITTMLGTISPEQLKAANQLAPLLLRCCEVYQ